MSEILTTVVAVLVAYLVGAIPFGLLIGRAHGVDVRQHGSRNIGATNVGRVIGYKWGKLCLLLDILKGLLPVLAARFLVFRDEPDAGGLACWLLIAVAAVLGHVFPVYLRFRGGKGVATTIGVALGVVPYYTVAMVAALLGYALVRFTTGLVSLGSLTIAVVFPLALYAYLRLQGLPLARFWPLLVVAIALGLLILVRHRSNLRRLLRGEEYRPTTNTNLQPTHRDMPREE
ncbi:MAG: glycerol-3-phosphate 1-O-acyltransferase PlsY [Planctomycetota bacterium]